VVPSSSSCCQSLAATTIVLVADAQTFALFVQEIGVEHVVVNSHGQKCAEWNLHSLETPSNVVLDVQPDPNVGQAGAVRVKAGLEMIPSFSLDRKVVTPPVPTKQTPGRVGTGLS